MTTKEELIGGNPSVQMAEGIRQQLKSLINHLDTVECEIGAQAKEKFQHVLAIAEEALDHLKAHVEGVLLKEGVLTPEHESTTNQPKETA